MKLITKALNCLVRTSFFPRANFGWLPKEVVSLEKNRLVDILFSGTMSESSTQQNLVCALEMS